MKKLLLLISVAALSIAAADAALARSKHRRAAAPCVDRTQTFSWDFLLPGTRAPQPNGCAPPVYQYNRFVGQDPDPNIRFQLLRDPATGSSGPL